jgi:hypothetical protein
MLILAKKKDYYDGVAGSTGIDKTIVYDRQIVELEKDELPDQFKKSGFYDSFREREKSPLYRLSNATIRKEYHKIYPRGAHFIIGFCGKLYIGWKFYSFKENYYDAYDNINTTINYNIDEIKQVLEPMTWDGAIADHIDYIQKFDAMDWFRKFNAPCFVYDHDYKRKSLDIKYWRGDNTVKFIINPLLKEYEFFKVFDSFQAFQEIQMFISGVLGNKEKEIVQVADKYKIAGHGFDKWSFRKEPKEKK